MMTRYFNVLDKYVNLNAVIPKDYSNICRYDLLCFLFGRLFRVVRAMK